MDLQDEVTAASAEDPSLSISWSLVNVRLNGDEAPAIIAPPGYAEDRYLASHPTVADAAQEGRFESGLHQRVLYGKREARAM